MNSVHSFYYIIIATLNIYFYEVEIFIGIDQSINSTGITLQKFDNDVKIKEHFYIIHQNKYTKKEQEANNQLDNFDYVSYDKREKKESKDNSEFEMNKLLNNIDISDNILNIIKLSVDNKLDKIYVAMEGVSYSSTKTQSIADLSGLSTLIRYKIYKYFQQNQDNCGKLYILTPNEVKKFASGIGNAKKDIMISLFKQLYPKLNLIPKIDDIADSYWICSYCRNLYKTEYGSNNN